MFESNSKFPKIFVYMMSLIALIMFVGIFFGVGYVGKPYFIALIICVILFILDKRADSNLTNYKLTYLLFDIVNLIAVISVIYYEYSRHTNVLNIFLILLLVLEFAMGIIDIFVLKNSRLTKKNNFLINFAKLCSMICIITYFFGVSKLYFAISAFVFEFSNIAVKIFTYYKNKNIVENKPDKKDVKIEDIISSGYDNEGSGE